MGGVVPGAQAVADAQLPKTLSKIVPCSVPAITFVSILLIYCHSVSMLV